MHQVAVVHGVVADLEQLRMGPHDGHDLLARVAVCAMAPVGKSVAQTWLAIRKFRMSTPGSSRPPMSRVMAIARPASGMRLKVCGCPAATRFPARQPEVTGGGAVGRAVGCGVGRGVAFGSADTISSQPACSVSGLLS